jgi:tetrapyrrole methylase family protein / MazG family protein
LRGIVILGLGPGAAEQLTLEAQAVLQAASEVFLRTEQHPTVTSLPPHLVRHSFDHVYRREASFGAVYRAIAQEVVSLGQRPQGVVYAVPGHPLMAEASVQEILRLADAAGLPVRIVAGVSFLEPVCTALGLDPLADGLLLLDATALSPSEPFAPLAPLTPTRPLLLAQLYGDRVASAAKLALLEVYPPEHPVTLVRAAGVAGSEAVRRIPLYQLDRQADLDPLTCAYLPPLGTEGDVGSLAGFQLIVARLRAPGGCPWDREQTHASLRPNLLEEAYETLEALDDGDPAKLQEELGDLLLQIVLHAQVAVEAGEFALSDVVRGISEKIIRRHPHVFADAKVADVGELLQNWERIKQKERDENHGEGEGEDHARSLLAGVPASLPALAASQSIQERAARVGFDWASVEGVLDHALGELRELKEADGPEEKRDEFGDILFAVVNAGRWMGIDAEDALRLANRRFQRRFQGMEALCRQRGVQFADLSFDEQNTLWDEVKASES